MVRPITERFTRAVEQLGNVQIPVRVGAIYGLERIAGESEKDRWPIVELLSTFVRYSRPLGRAEENSPKPGADIQAALTVLGRLVRVEDLDYRQIVDLSESDLRGAVFDSANLPGVRFTGSRLDGASFVATNLYKAVFLGASLEMANLTEANLELADFEQARAPHADFSGARLSGAILKSANMEGADLHGADVQGTILELTHFEGADLRNTVGTPFMFPLPFAEVFVDDRTQFSAEIEQWLNQNHRN